MENLVNLHPAFWRGRSVLVTGHTGFKGGWLALWLHRLGAQVHGYALHPPTEPSLFEVVRLGAVLASDTRADLADRERLPRLFPGFSRKSFFIWPPNPWCGRVMPIRWGR